MGIATDILNKVKIFLSDLRKNLGLLFIIGIIWILLILGILFLKIYVGNLTPIPEFANNFSPYFVSFVTGVVKVGIAGIYVLIWLYIWHRMVRMYFWRTAKKYLSVEDNNNNEANQ